MLTLTVTFYDVVLTVHIIAVVVAFGVMFAYPVMDARRAVRAPPTSRRCTACRSRSGGG